MKKTIAKIMAAAMVLSTVVAPNVNAASSLTAAQAALAGVPVPLTGLHLSQIAATLNGNVNSHDLLTTDLVGSRNNPVDAGFTVNRNTAGQIVSVDSDLYLTGTGNALNGDLLYFDVGTGNVAVQVANAATTVSVSDFTNGNITLYKDTNTTKVAAKNTIAAYAGVDVTGLTDRAAGKKIVDAIKTGEVDITDISEGVNTQNNGSKIANNVLKTTVSNGIFKDDVYIGGDVFDGGYQVMGDGHFRFIVGTPSSDDTAKIEAALNASNPIVLRMTIGFNAAFVRDAAGNPINDKQAWVRLSPQEQAAYDGYVILHQDNGYNRHIGVNYTVVDGTYAEITAANNDVLKSDVAKGGRLYLDYVYNRTNTNADVTSARTYKIRTIGSRVFKEGKFQTISGLGDDGAKYIRTIHNGAFRKCKQLKKVNLDTNKKIRKINSKAFYDCKKLATVKMDARGLKAVGSDAFKNCKSNIKFKLKGNSSQVKKAWAKIKKQAPKKAKYSKI